MRNKVELLAPAGSPEGIRAAVQSGAGAVYMGFGMFNARRNAQGFSHDEMADAIAYCRARDVKTNITLNILAGDRELEDALEDAKFLYEAGATFRHFRPIWSCCRTQARTHSSFRIWDWRGSSTHTRRISRCTPPRR